MCPLVAEPLCVSSSLAVSLSLFPWVYMIHVSVMLIVRIICIIGVIVVILVMMMVLVTLKFVLIYFAGAWVGKHPQGAQAADVLAVSRERHVRAVRLAQLLRGLSPAVRRLRRHGDDVHQVQRVRHTS